MMESWPYELVLIKGADLGDCAVLITTMKLIKDSHFGFIVRDVPVGTSDIASWGQVRSVSGQLNTNCVKDPPQGKKQGRIQRAGKTPFIRSSHRRGYYGRH